jgi:excisionase family DNA binding protein
MDDFTQQQRDIIGDNVRQLRIKHKTRERQLAQYLGSSGAWIVQAIERGEWNASEEELAKIAQFFSISVESLFIESEGMQGRREEKQRVHERRHSLEEALDWEMGDLLTTSEVAQILRVDISTIRRWINEGALDAVILPGKARHRYRIRKSTIDTL